MSGSTVSSGNTTSAGMNGRKAAAGVSTGTGATMSGYSCGGISWIAIWPLSLR